MEALPPSARAAKEARRHRARGHRGGRGILLADEPNGNVDPNLEPARLRLFIELNKSGTTIIIATHDIGLAVDHDCRRFVCMMAACILRPIEAGNRWYMTELGSDLDLGQ